MGDWQLSTRALHPAGMGHHTVHTMQAWGITQCTQCRYGASHRAHNAGMGHCMQLRMHFVTVICRKTNGCDRHSHLLKHRLRSTTESVRLQAEGLAWGPRGGCRASMGCNGVQGSGVRGGASRKVSTKGSRASCMYTAARAVVALACSIQPIWGRPGQRHASTHTRGSQRHPTGAL